jgi:hypothetical protein
MKNIEFNYVQASYNYSIVNESREIIQVIDRNPDGLLIEWVPGVLTPMEWTGSFRK